MFARRRPVAVKAEPSAAHYVLEPDLAEASVAASAAMVSLLVRARGVVSDASNGLATSFESLKNIIAQQQHALQTLTESLGGGTSEGFSAVAQKLVSEFVGEFVRVSHESMRILEMLDDTNGFVDAIVGRTREIDGLAKEIRFIALNARIETQRAGDAGRTFKVVAEEVRRLSQGSALLSTKIRDEIKRCADSLAVTRSCAINLASHDMSTALKSRDALLDILGKLDQVNSALAGALEQVGHAVGHAVRALQFEDMVTQILVDAERRVGQYAELMLTAVKIAHGSYEGPKSMRHVCDELHALGNVGSVEQTSVSAGDIDLF
jgi:methyl-accepting chemotaxis protein